MPLHVNISGLRCPFFQPSYLSKPAGKFIGISTSIINAKNCALLLLTTFKYHWVDQVTLQTGSIPHYELTWPCSRSAVTWCDCWKDWSRSQFHLPRAAGPTACVTRRHVSTRQWKSPQSSPLPVREDQRAGDNILFKMWHWQLKLGCEQTSLFAWTASIELLRVHFRKGFAAFAQSSKMAMTLENKLLPMQNNRNTNCRLFTERSWNLFHPLFAGQDREDLLEARVGHCLLVRLQILSIVGREEVEIGVTSRHNVLELHLVWIVGNQAPMNSWHYVFLRQIDLWELSDNLNPIWGTPKALWSPEKCTVPFLG